MSRTESGGGIGLASHHRLHQQPITEYIIGRISRETDTETNTETDMEMDIVTEMEIEKDKKKETERGKVEKGRQRGMSLD